MATVLRALGASAQFTLIQNEMDMLEIQLEHTDEPAEGSALAQTDHGIALLAFRQQAEEQLENLRSELLSLQYFQALGWDMPDNVNNIDTQQAVVPPVPEVEVLVPNSRQAVSSIGQTQRRPKRKRAHILEEKEEGGFVPTGRYLHRGSESSHSNDDSVIFVSERRLPTQGPIRPGDFEEPIEVEDWRPATRPCTACLDEISVHVLIEVECRHEYCLSCLKNLFILATADEQLYPPQCCSQNIPLEVVEDVMSATEISKFVDAGIEFSTPNRVYCHFVHCGAFIPPPDVQSNPDRAHCTKCNRNTCMHCKGPHHIGECEQDEALQQALSAAAAHGWRRCPKCSTMVELGSGCNHIHCKCKHHFCYACGKQWKSCPCPTYPTGEARRLALRH